MVDPVTAADHHTYERGKVEQWYAQCTAQQQPFTSPFHGGQVPSAALNPNHAMRKVIEDWVENNPYYYD